MSGLRLRPVLSSRRLSRVLHCSMRGGRLCLAESEQQDDEQEERVVGADESMNRTTESPAFDVVTSLAVLR